MLGRYSGLRGSIGATYLNRSVGSRSVRALSGRDSRLVGCLNVIHSLFTITGIKPEDFFQFFILGNVLEQTFI